ncbi:MAG: PQQ-binding-like beta-propeller repeat protein, partial [Terriglobales bacterium]
PKGGDNLFLSSILAVRPDTGRLVWHYQTTPGDMWDYTATQPMILATLEIEGVARRVLMQAPKNGFFYVLDRETGKLISAEKFVRMSWASRVDFKSGRPVKLAAADYRQGKKLVFPWFGGGHNWHPMAYHPGTQLVYVPVWDVGMNYKTVDRYEFDARRTNTALDYSVLDITPRKSALLAWDPRRQIPAWRVDHPGFRNGGVLATGGNLVFQGTMQGTLAAYRASNGERLLALATGTSILAAPASYAIEGTQYIVVMAGFGGSGLESYPEGSAARRYGNEGRILAFRLDGRPVPRPPEVDWDANLPALPASPRLSTAQRARGEQIFYSY